MSEVARERVQGGPATGIVVDVEPALDEHRALLTVLGPALAQVEHGHGEVDVDVAGARLQRTQAGVDGGDRNR